MPTLLHRYHYIHLMHQTYMHPKTNILLSQTLHFSLLHIRTIASPSTTPNNTLQNTWYHKVIGWLYHHSHDLDIKTAKLPGPLPDIPNNRLCIGDGQLKI